MTYDELIAALESTGIPFAEGGWEEADALREDYGVYALDGRRDMVSDGRHSEKIPEGTVDLFCRRPNRGRHGFDRLPVAAGVRAAL